MLSLTLRVFPTPGVTLSLGVPLTRTESRSDMLSAAAPLACPGLSAPAPFPGPASRRRRRRRRQQLQRDPRRNRPHWTWPCHAAPARLPEARYLAVSQMQPGCSVASPPLRSCLLRPRPQPATSPAAGSR